MFLTCRATIRYPRGGGGDELYLFQPGSAARWKFQILLHIQYHRTEINYLFHAESAQNYLFLKNSSVSPPPGDSMVVRYT